MTMSEKNLRKFAWDATELRMQIFIDSSTRGSTDILNLKVNPTLNTSYIAHAVDDFI